ncbi:MAG: hypothetical protein P4K98_08330 [Bryobacteraceae bacterium]|nr:hypothetical protein [Bryobacteraceae bacterium]
MQSQFDLTPLQRQVLDFTTLQLHLKPSQARLDARLLHDLGLTGHRARSFIQAFSHEFNVNCDALLDRDEWNRHFGRERFPRRLPIFLAVTLFVTAMILGGQLDVQWLWLVVAVGVWLARSKAWPMGRGRSDMLPVTILDLVAAVEEGEWIKALH